MSNLIPSPGSSPSLAVPAEASTGPTTWVQVQDLGTAAAGGGDEIHLGEIWRALRRRKRLVALTATTVILLAAAITVHQRLFSPTYQGSFDLLIADPVGSDNQNGGAGSPGGGNEVFARLALNSGSNQDLPTLIEVLRSSLLISPVASSFGLEPGDLASRLTITPGGARAAQAQGVLKVALTGRDPEAAAKELEALSQAYLRYSLQQRQEQLTEGLSFLDRQAPQLQTKLNQVQAELANFRETHNQLEPDTEGAALKTRILSLEEAKGELQAERSRLTAVQAGIRSGRLTAQGFQEAVSTGPSVSGNGTSTRGGGLSITGTGQALLEQLAQLEQKLAEARGRYTSSSSTVQGLQARRDALAERVKGSQLEAVQAALSLNAERIATNRRQIAALTSTFQLQPALIKQYQALQQRLSIAQENLAGFLSTRETFQLELAQRTVPWRVIAPPQVNPKPVKPSVPRNLALGVFVGLAAGAAAGLLRDRLDHVYRSPGDVKDELQEPLLGHIPHIPLFRGVREDRRFLLDELDRSSAPAGVAASSNGLPAMERYQRFFYQEAFRNLFTSLRFLNTGRPLRSIALTSSLPAEGKSLVNVLLAKTLSEMGQRVLLVDADLRKPQLHTRLGLDNLLGLSNLLSGDAPHWQPLLQSVPGHPTWQVITAGRRAPDPARLLSSTRMKELIEQFANSGQFDLILYDTPPVLGLADSALVAEHLDGLMLLVSLERVDRRLPREAIGRIRSAGVPLLGLVTNAVKQESQDLSAYGYGRYGYGRYGYGRYGYGRYGYAGYDYQTAAAYYTEADVETDADATGTKAPTGQPVSGRPTREPSLAGSPTSSAPPTSRRPSLRRLGRRLIQWIDH
ncbi:GumC family protein [Synechococcus sp. CCY9202]|uniref:GumC family protein n=1 Tax=Synechococcus sp. CCY9202 TaxID=174698 RepID=UPI002B1F1538|nr:polysaccharide biosynthesis tyrosine autokinase [Synechococcus sp. CCY9202]MEA5423093.1 polysaccharide biosynthesis tyrosine autokinase [Synechococcus sp. CCY9202]